jgi:hypothetical protein
MRKSRRAICQAEGVASHRPQFAVADVRSGPFAAGRAGIKSGLVRSATES